jgi:hypothetical protein
MVGFYGVDGTLPQLPRSGGWVRIAPKDVMSSSSDPTCRDFLSSSAECVRAGVLTALEATTSPSMSPMSIARPGTSAGRAPPGGAGRCSRAPSQPAAAAAPMTTTARPSRSAVTTARACRLRASCSSAHTTRHGTRTRRGGASARMTVPVRAKPLVTQMRRGRLPATSCRHARVDLPERTERPQRFPLRDHPIKHHVAGSEPTRVVDRSKAGRPRAHKKPGPSCLTPGRCTSKGGGLACRQGVGLSGIVGRAHGAPAGSRLGGVVRRVRVRSRRPDGVC